MFDPGSRYYALPIRQQEDAEGHSMSYVSRRFLPQGETLPVLLNIKTQYGDRLDQLAARTLGNPLQFWRICDANNAMLPSDLTHPVGQTLIVPRPTI